MGCKWHGRLGSAVWMLCCLVAAASSSCTNRTGSSGRLQVRCTSHTWLDVLSLPSICDGNQASPVSLIMRSVPAMADGIFNLTLPASSEQNLDCLHDVRIISSPLSTFVLDVQLPALTKLSIRQTSLSGFPEITRWQPTLKLLNLSHNALTSIAVSQVTQQTVPSLEVLDLSFNKISSLPPEVFSQFRSLLELHLSNNTISDIAPNSLSGLLSLTYINLEGNDLQTLVENSLRVAPRHHLNVNLAGNPVRTVHADALVLFRSMNLTLDSTDLTCDCKVQTLRLMIQFTLGIAATCARPASLSQQPLFRVPIGELVCSSSVNFLEGYYTKKKTVLVSAPGTLSCTFDVSSGSQSTFNPRDVDVTWFKDATELRTTRAVLPYSRKRRSSDGLDIFRTLLLSSTQDVGLFGASLPIRYIGKVVADPQRRNRYTSTLTIKNVSYVDMGRYFCKVSLDSTHYDSHKTNLYVDVPARIISVDGPREVTRGEDAQFTCSARGHPLPTVSWQFTSVEGDVNEFIHLDTLQDDVKKKYQLSTRLNGSLTMVSTLSIVNADTSTSGKYTCLALNSYRLEDRDVMLNVRVPPYGLSTRQSAVAVRAGEAVILQCLSKGSQPLKFAWYRHSNGGDRQQIKHEESGGQPQIVSAAEMSNLFYMNAADVGSHSYMCVVSNDLGNASAQFKFTVANSGGIAPEPIHTKHPERSSAHPTTTVPCMTSTVVPATAASSADSGRPGGTACVPAPAAPTSPSDFYRIPFFVTVAIALAIGLALLVALFFTVVRTSKANSDDGSAEKV